MERLRNQYRLAQEALAAGQVERAAARVRAAGRELDAILGSLSRESGLFHEPSGSLPRRPRQELRRRTALCAIQPGAVPAAIAELEQLMRSLRSLASEMDKERSAIRTSRQWLSGQASAGGAPGRGCLDLSR